MGIPTPTRDALLSRWKLIADHPHPLALQHKLHPGTVATPALEAASLAMADTVRRRDGRLIISFPPQEGKSTLADSLCVQQLATNPDTRILIASYGQDLAQEHGETIRKHITDNPWLGVTIRRGKASATNWRLTNHRGGVYSVGIGGGTAGHPADLVIIDDPVKSRDEADSEVYRKRAWHWYLNDIVTRLSPGAAVILIQTRWHADDLAGRLLEEQPGRWRNLRIPAQCDDPATDPLGRELGEYMESARAGGRNWEDIKTQVGSRAWNALYQGHPAPAEGGLLKREWWQRYTTAPADATLLQSWDLTFKDAKHADFVVGQVWAQHGAQAFLLDQVRGRWGFTETVEQIKALSARWPQAHTKLIEDKANGPAVIDSLSKQLPGIIPVNPQGGKESRAAAVSPFIEAGNVFLPRGVGWVDEFVEECAGFPNAAHDDQVDAMTQALARMFVTQTRQGTGFYNFG